MNWKIEIKPNAEKQYCKLDKKTRKRLKDSLQELLESDTPLHHKNVRPLTGQLQGDFRLRVGDLRFLFTPDRNSQVLFVYAILPRGDVY